MKTNEYLNDDVVDLGAVTTETRGSAPFGRDDTLQGQKYALGGIETDD